MLLERIAPDDVIRIILVHRDGDRAYRRTGAGCRREFGTNDTRFISMLPQQRRADSGDGPLGSRIPSVRSRRRRALERYHGHRVRRLLGASDVDLDRESGRGSLGSAAVHQVQCPRLVASHEAGDSLGQEDLSALKQPERGALAHVALQEPARGAQIQWRHSAWTHVHKLSSHVRAPSA